MSTKKSAGKLSKNPMAASAALKVLLLAGGYVGIQRVPPATVPEQLNQLKKEKK